MIFSGNLPIFRMTSRLSAVMSRLSAVMTRLPAVISPHREGLLTIFPVMTRLFWMNHTIGLV